MQGVTQVEINAEEFTATVTVEPNSFDVKKAVVALKAFPPSKVDDVSKANTVKAEDAKPETKTEA